MFKRSPIKQRAHDVALEVRQYGRIVASGSAGSVETRVARKPPEAKKQKLLNKSAIVMDKGETNPRPSKVVTDKRTISRAYSRASKEGALENRSTADTRTIRGGSDIERQDSVGELIEKAKKELEEIQPNLTTQSNHVHKTKI